MVNTEEIQPAHKNPYDYCEGIVSTTITDNIIEARGLEQCVLGELVLIGPAEEQGIVVELKEETVLISLLKPLRHIAPNHKVISRGNVVSVPVGNALLGRIVNPLGEPLDDLGPIHCDKYYPIEYAPANVMARAGIRNPLSTGIKMIDSLIPIGKGQRELLIGDSRTGKTNICLNAIINQKDTNVKCIYVAIGKNASDIINVVETLKEHNAFSYTIIVFAGCNDSASLQIMSPQAGCSMGEYFRNHGEDALIIYDDLTRHAWAYRQLSLLLRKTPGREAYPADIFYLHARLLERAAHVNQSFVEHKTEGKVINRTGSLTALPILETQENDITSFIATNVVSITDGQIFLDSTLARQNIRPAINLSRSISRVGNVAQTPIIRQLSASILLDLLQYQSLENFAITSFEASEESDKVLSKGIRSVEIFQQNQFAPSSLADLALSLLIIMSNVLVDIAVKLVRRFESFVHYEIKMKEPLLYLRLKEERKLSSEEIESYLAIIKLLQARFIAQQDGEEVQHV